MYTCIQPLARLGGPLIHIALYMLVSSFQLCEWFERLTQVLVRWVVNLLGFVISTKTTKLQHVPQCVSLPLSYMYYMNTQNVCVQVVTTCTFTCRCTQCSSALSFCLCISTLPPNLPPSLCSNAPQRWKRECSKTSPNAVPSTRTYTVFISWVDYPFTCHSPTLHYTCRLAAFNCVSGLKDWLKPSLGELSIYLCS